MSELNSNSKQMLDDTHDHVNKKQRPKSFNKLLSMRLSKEMMQNIQEGDFIFERLIKSGHLISIVAESGSGKTTIMTFAAARMVANGLDVLYINMDAAKFNTIHWTNIGFVWFTGCGQENRLKYLVVFLEGAGELPATFDILYHSLLTTLLLNWIE